MSSNHSILNPIHYCDENSIYHEMMFAQFFKYVALYKKKRVQGGLIAHFIDRSVT